MLILAFSVCVTHPVCVLLSLCGAAAYDACLHGGRRMLRRLPGFAVLFLLTAAINPAFRHQGVTVLCYLPTGNPLTLESVLYGLNAAAMLCAVLVWFFCVQTVFTSDKLLHLTGRAAPSISLFLSMTLRFVPRLRAQANAVSSARRGLGFYGDGSFSARVREGVHTLSALLTWSFENALESADSMRARGYGLPGRTAYSPAVWTLRDRMLCAWLAFCGLYLFSGAAAGGFFWKFYPAMRGAENTPFSVSFFLVYAALSLTPAVLNRWEVRKWKRHSPSGI